MNYFDFVLIIIIILITIRGVFRGLITELAVLVAIILGFVVTITYLQTSVQLLLSFFPDIPEFVARILVFILLFLLVNIIVRLIGNSLNKFAKITFMQPVNKVAGGVFAFTKITIILSILIILIEFIPYSKNFLNMVGREDSLFYDWVKNFAPNTYRLLTAILPGSDHLTEKLMQGLNVADSTAKELVKPF